MEPIYHLVLPSTWQASDAPDFRADSLEGEGFIHCCYAHQLAWAANKFYASADGLLALRIDPLRLDSRLVVEPPAAKSGGELFPHVYGPINRSAVVEVLPLRRGENGLWAHPIDGGEGSAAP